MSNYYAPCFYRIDFFVIPSYLELPCFKAQKACCRFADFIIFSGEWVSLTLLLGFKTLTKIKLPWEKFPVSYSHKLIVYFLEVFITLLLTLFSGISLMSLLIWFWSYEKTHLALTCSKSTIETLEKGVTYVQS